MGDGADMLQEWEEMHEFEQYKHDQYLFKNDIWVTQNDEEIKITDLADDHLINIIAWLSRHSGPRQLYLDKMNAEHKRRGL